MSHWSNKKHQASRNNSTILSFMQIKSKIIPRTPAIDSHRFNGPSKESIVKTIVAGALWLLELDVACRLRRVVGMAFVVFRYGSRNSFWEGGAGMCLCKEANLHPFDPHLHLQQRL